MSNTEPDPTGSGTPDPDATDPPDAGPEKDPAAAELAKWKRHARHHEKQAAEAAARLKDIEDADKTEVQKAAERANAAEARANAAELHVLRLEVASEKGLTAKQAHRLVGTTREELEADADELLETFAGNGDTRQPPGGRPKERLKGGHQPSEEPEETDPRKLAAKIPRL